MNIRKVLVLCVTLCVIVLAAGFASAATYYVRTDGNDANTGSGNSASEAWATIQHSADSAQPGDVVLVQAGTYLENVTITKAGTSSLPITFRGEGPVSVGNMSFARSSNWTGSISYYVVIDQFTFDGGLQTADSGIYMAGAGAITISNCTFKNYTLGIRFDNNGWSGNYSITTRNCLFENNTYGANAWGSGMLNSSLFDGCTFRGNTIGFYSSNWGVRYNTFSQCRFENNDYGAVLEGVYWYWLKTHHNAFQHSVFSNNGTGLLIGDAQGSSYNSSSYANSVINSTFFGNAGAGIQVKANFDGVNDMSPAWYDAQGQTFANNIFMNNGTYGIDNVFNRTLFSGYNLAFGNGSGAGSNAVFDASNNSLNADPMLADPAAGDLTLRFGSPCIDAGNPAYDTDPLKQGDHIDIGAFELNATPAQIAQELSQSAGGIPESYLKNKNNSGPLSKKFYVVMEMIVRGDEAADPVQQSNFYHAALQKLENDILPKTDGCALSGAPDKNDWITACDTQADFHGPIASLIEMLTAKTSK